MALGFRFAEDAFDLVDVHHRGWVNDTMALELLKTLGLHGMSQQEQIALVRSMDPGATSRIEKAEFEQAVRRRMSAPDTPEELAELLRLLDPTESGITSVDLKAIFAKYNVEASDEALQELLQHAADSSPVLTNDHWRALNATRTSRTRKPTKY
jgi:Ca2+-binding EF-hand superfamily protein